MNKVIVSTTINPVTTAIAKFAAMKDWKLVISGDNKTPEPYFENVRDWDNCFYLDPPLQESFDPKLSELIGWNCIQRRNFAFLFACKELKADIIYTCDDDNIPMYGWGENCGVGFEVPFDEYDVADPAFDPLSVTVHSQLWHRGYPVELLKGRFRNSASVNTEIDICNIQANLWNGEADVDAMCRLSYETSSCNFGNISRMYSSTKPSPFNSQNTFLSREVMPHYFMFPGIGRYDDIMASYHVQAHGFRVMYGGPTVVQKRNEHSLIADLMAEMWGIEKCLSVVKEVPINKNAVLDRLPERSLAAFRQYQTHFE